MKQFARLGVGRLLMQSFDSLLLCTMRPVLADKLNSKESP